MFTVFHTIDTPKRCFLCNEWNIMPTLLVYSSLPAYWRPKSTTILWITFHKPFGPIVDTTVLALLNCREKKGVCFFTVLKILEKMEFRVNIQSFCCCSMTCERSGVAKTSQIDMLPIFNTRWHLSIFRPFCKNIVFLSCHALRVEKAQCCG